MPTTASNDNIRSLMLTCRRFQRILYQPSFWQMAASAAKFGNLPPFHSTVGQSLLWVTLETRSHDDDGKATTSTSTTATTTESPIGFCFHGFRKKSQEKCLHLRPELPGEQRFLVTEHATGHDLVLSYVTVDFMETLLDDRTHRRRLSQLIPKLQLGAQIRRHNDNKEKVVKTAGSGGKGEGNKMAATTTTNTATTFTSAVPSVQICLSINDSSLTVLQCMNPAVLTEKYRIQPDIAYAALCSDTFTSNGPGLPAELQSVWPSLIDWLHQMRATFYLTPDMTLRVAQWLPIVYSQISSPTPFSYHEVQLVAFTCLNFVLSVGFLLEQP